MPLRLSLRESISLFSIEIVPTRAGCPRSWQSTISSTTASHFSGRAVDHVGAVVADHRLVRRNDHHVEIVDLAELGGLGLGGSGHPASLSYMRK